MNCRAPGDDRKLLMLDTGRHSTQHQVITSLPIFNGVRRGEERGGERGRRLRRGGMTKFSSLSATQITYHNSHRNLLSRIHSYKLSKKKEKVNKTSCSQFALGYSNNLPIIFLNLPPPPSKTANEFPSGLETSIIQECFRDTSRSKVFQRHQ